MPSVVVDDEDLLQLVSDEYDRLPRFLQRAHDRKQLLSLLGREHGRGLVEDQDLRLSVECLHDLDALLNSYGKLLDYGVPRAWEFHGLLIDEDLALVGVIQPVQDVHESGLPGAILAEERVDLAGLHREIDVIIGDHAGEDLRDPPQLETHGDFLPQTEERECRRRHPLSLNPWRS